MRYQTIAECVEEGCRCDDRAGVILYNGSVRKDAEAAKRQAPHGYAVRVDESSNQESVEPSNISIYWDHSRDVVGVRFGEYRHEEPINGRSTLSDGELVQMIDRALECPEHLPSN